TTLEKREKTELRRGGASSVAKAAAAGPVSRHDGLVAARRVEAPDNAKLSVGDVHRGPMRGHGYGDLPQRQCCALTWTTRHRRDVARCRAAAAGRERDGANEQHACANNPAPRPRGTPLRRTPLSDLQ